MALLLRELFMRTMNEYVEKRLPTVIDYYDNLNSDQQLVFMKLFFNQMKEHLLHISNLKDFVSELIMCTHQTLQLLTYEDALLREICRNMFDNIQSVLSIDVFRIFMQNICRKRCVSLYCFDSCVIKSINSTKLCTKELSTI